MAQDQKKVVFLSNSSTVLEGPLKAYFLTIGFDGCLVQDLSEFDNISEKEPFFLLLRDESLEPNKDQVKRYREMCELDLLLRPLDSIQSFASSPISVDSVFFTNNRYLHSLLLLFLSKRK